MADFPKSVTRSKPYRRAKGLTEEERQEIWQALNGKRKMTPARWEDLKKKIPNKRYRERLNTLMYGKGTSKAHVVYDMLKASTRGSE